MTLVGIVEQYLRAIGMDGLANSDAECGCHVDDLMPCSDPGMGCEAARNDKARAKAEGLDYWMVPCGKALATGHGFNSDRKTERG